MKEQNTFSKETLGECLRLLRITNDIPTVALLVKKQGFLHLI